MAYARHCLSVRSDRMLCSMVLTWLFGLAMHLLTRKPELACGHDLRYCFVKAAAAKVLSQRTCVTN